MVDESGNVAKTVPLQLQLPKPKENADPSTLASALAKSLFRKSPKKLPTLVNEPRLVTEENKQEYLQALAQFRLHQAMAPHIDSFVEGFRKLVFLWVCFY